MVEPPSSKPEVVIVGAGLAGTLLACYLARAGQRVDVYEKRADPRRREQEHGRSINLALSLRGIHALREIGLADEVLKSSILMRGRMIHSLSGQLTFQPYGKDDGQALHSVSRAGLNLMLVEAAAREPSIRLFFEHKCLGVDVDNNTVAFVDMTTHSNREINANLIVGADGAYSAVRGSLQKQERFNYRQDYLSHGYKELSIPAGPNGTFRLEKHALHIWPRGSFMMIALPNRDGSFTCTLFWPFEGPNSFAALTNAASLQAFFAQQFPDAVPLIPTLADDFLHNPTGPLVTIRCQPWHWGERVVLLGDACHAVVPFLGQGMNAAFEDCSVLADCLARRASLADYETLRKQHLDTLAELCIDNFLEMRDRVASRLFVLRKKLALALHRLFPRYYIPLYVMIEFTRIPYADAVRRARRQDWLVRGLAVALLLIFIVAGFWLARWKEFRMDLTYASYLKLDRLLDLQQPRSDPVEHDEMLFIVSHQAYELWFKLQLHELDKIKRDFLDNHLYGAIATFKRARTIMKVMVEQIDILETLTPMSFNSFRARLETASGFQSSQFREFEFVLGYKRKDLLRYQQADTPAYECLLRRLQEPSIVDCFYSFLERHGVAIPAELRTRDRTLPSIPNEIVEEGILRSYKSRPELEILFELMTDFDEGFQEWRYRHIKLVERSIGSKKGTGGSLGVDFLKKSLFHPVFHDLWAIRHKL